MKKLIALFSILSPIEVRQFERFVNSPYHNANTQVKGLLRYLIRSKEINMEEYLKKQKVPLSKIRYIASDLCLLLEEFIISKELKQNSALHAELLLKGLHTRGETHYFNILLNQVRHQQNQALIKDSVFYKHREELDEISYFHTSLYDNRSLDNSLQSLSDHLDLHYLCKKLKYACEIYNRQHILSVSYRFPFLEYILKYIETNNELRKHPAINIYYVTLNMIRSGDPAHYRDLKQLLITHLVEFTSQEMKDMFTFAQNYCIQQVNKGNVGYYEELFLNYEVMISSGIIIENDAIAQFDFKNIVTIALRLKKFDWAEKFISDFSKNLPKENRLNSTNYNQAQLYYARSEFGAALKLLTKVEYTDVYYHLDSKVLLIKIYYETGQVEPLYSLIASFKTYLARNKMISAYQQVIYSNFIRFLKKILKIKFGGKNTALQLQNEIRDKKQVADINWLIAKLDELTEIKTKH